MNHIEKLEYLGACSDDIACARQHKSMKSVWDTLNDPECLLWLLGKLEYRDDRNYRLFACWCVRNTPLTDGRVVWDLVTDPRASNAVEVAERYADGNATREELAAAGGASWTSTARGAAMYTVSDAAEHASRDAAYNAAGHSAMGVGYDRAVTWAAAWQHARAAQCDKIREMFPWAKVSRLFAKVGAK